MSYLVLALKYRPQRFADVAGQGPVSRTLSNALSTGRAAQAYLFSGPRGVGKTSMARILAKALNCERGPADEPCNECRPCREITNGRAVDVIEIDGASNRGIDDIRELREAVRYAPVTLSRKVYIIDEVHMLTQDAFNALLKTLEEPPRHVVFVLATTEPLKIPQTILSRCQRFDFARMRVRDAAARLRFICDQEEIEAEEDALILIARKGDGSMRDALTLLDQVVAAGIRPLTAGGIRESMGISGRELFFEWTTAMAERDAARVLRSLGEAVEGGANLIELGEEFLQHLRDLLFVATDASLSDQVEATEDERALYLKQVADLPAADLLRACRLCLDMIPLMRRSAFPRVHLEVLLAELCMLPGSVELRRFLEATRGRSGSDEAKHSTIRQSRRGTAAGIGAGGGPVAYASGERSSREKPSEDRSVGSDPLGLGSSESPHVSPADPASHGPQALASIHTDDPWACVLEALARKKPALASLLMNSCALGEDDRILRIQVPKLAEFSREQLEKKTSKRLLQELVEEAYQRPLGLRYEEGESAAEASPTAAPLHAAPPSGARGAREAPQERIARIADKFDGDVIGPA